MKFSDFKTSQEAKEPTASDDAEQAAAPDTNKAAEGTQPELSKEERLEVERDEVLASVASAKFDTLQEKVAWILNHHPPARNSDITLQIRFWEEFQPELAAGDYISKEDLYALARLTSLTRERARLQNNYKLFQANEAVRAARGTLSEEEKAKAVEQQIDTIPVFDVHADESGKTAAHLIVGSVWCLHPPELMKIRREILVWREQRKFLDELHFKTINDSNLAHYMSFADEMAARNTVFSFKAVSVERAGIKSVDDALQQLFFHMLVRGIEHEVETGRGPLPRVLQLWKDQEEPGRDKLFLAALKQKIRDVGSTQFGGRLTAAEFTATDSKGKLMVQVADLYTSSLNRVVNGEGRDGAKDKFARHFLNVLGLPEGPRDEEQVGDMTIHISL
jgi:hypothetical protein